MEYLQAQPQFVHKPKYAGLRTIHIVKSAVLLFWRAGERLGCVVQGDQPPLGHRSRPSFARFQSKRTTSTFQNHSLFPTTLFLPDVLPVCCFDPAQHRFSFPKSQVSTIAHTANDFLSLIRFTSPPFSIPLFIEKISNFNLDVFSITGPFSSTFALLFRVAVVFAKPHSRHRLSIFHYRAALPTRYAQRQSSTVFSRCRVSQERFVAPSFVVSSSRRHLT